MIRFLTFIEMEAIKFKKKIPFFFDTKFHILCGLDFHHFLFKDSILLARFPFLRT